MASCAFSFASSQRDLAIQELSVALVPHTLSVAPQARRYPRNDFAHRGILSSGAIELSIQKANQTLLPENTGPVEEPVVWLRHLLEVIINAHQQQLRNHKALLCRLVLI